jgi:hypothetical protein
MIAVAANSEVSIGRLASGSPQSDGTMRLLILSVLSVFAAAVRSGSCASPVVAVTRNEVVHGREPSAGRVEVEP